MSESPFVNKLGDALEAAFVAEEARAPKARRPFWWGRRTVLVAVAVVVVGCSAAVAKTLLNSTTLAINGVQCIEGTTFADPITDPPPPDYTKSPAQLCSTALSWPASKLTACARARDDYIFVFHSAGKHQCARLGLERVPRSYRLAQLRLERLTLAFNALNASATCVSPARYRAAGTRILDRLGWTGWSMFRGTPAYAVHMIGHGDCATVDMGYAALDPRSRTVSYDVGPPPALEKLVLALSDTLQRYSASRCLSRHALDAYASRLLAAHRLAAAFAYRSGSDLSGGQRRYLHGCPVVLLVRTAAGEDYGLADVIIYQQDAPPMPEHGLPAQSAFRRYAP